MNRFKDKRDSLELFIRKQLIGPGAYNNKFNLLSNIENENYRNGIDNQSAFENYQEIISEVPAYLYSSAILFPKTKVVENNENIIESNEIPFEEELINEENSEAIDDDNLDSDFSENLISKQQNYPNQFGMSFAVDRNFSPQDLKINFTFRKYKKLSKGELNSKRLLISIQDHKEEIKNIFKEYLYEYFEVIESNNNLHVKLTKNTDNNDFYNIEYYHLNKYINEVLKRKIEIILKEEIEIENDDIYVQTSNERLRILKKSTLNINNLEFNDVYKVYTYRLTNYFKTILKYSNQNFERIKDLVKELEVYEQVKEILNNFKSIFKSYKPLELWQSESYKLNIDLPLFDKQNNNIQRFSDDFSSEGFPKLKYAIQYLVDINNPEKVFIKIIINNVETVEIKENIPWINKNEKANEKALFGIKLIVKENNPEILKNYNNPRIIDFDEEDNYNKLLYKNFKAYGEGYNTSIDWYFENSLLRISTEFIPYAETPLIDFKPSKIENGEIVSRIKNENFVLSFKNLSTLSEITDNEIITELLKFIDYYEIWIEENKTKVDNQNENTLLLRQLNNCQRDYLRIRRNIHLLSTNPNAMVAFRVMNTAMYMQLLHGNAIKNDSSFLEQRLTEESYIETDLGEDYKWRAFQLAFILLNIDGFVKPEQDDNIVKDIFGTGWPERNELADLIWFPTGGGKTEAYLGLIAFSISYRRFTYGELGYGTTVLMRYTLRLLTLQQFQRATKLICALEIIRKDGFSIPLELSLGTEQITIGLFVGGDSLPNMWNDMLEELKNIKENIENNRKISTKLPFNNCPWCNHKLFINNNLRNIKPNPNNDYYGINSRLLIICNNESCSFYSRYTREQSALPIKLFDEDIYKYPPTLLFGTVDKFAAVANKVSNEASGRNQDTQRLFGKGYKDRNHLPPELIIQDELHLLLGPLGSAVGLLEKGIDVLCSYKDDNNQIIKPKIITSTATTRNTAKQIFALFNRRSQIFPKQGLSADDSFFAYYKRDQNEKFLSNRKYLGILPIGKTQVWMQLRIASLSLAHRLMYIKEKLSLEDVFCNSQNYLCYKEVLDYYHTVLSYFNSLKEVGKTQSQLSHYLPGDLNYIINNTMPWSFFDQITRNNFRINYSELTGRLNGEEVKTNLNKIEAKWDLLNEDLHLNDDLPPEFVISTNMISVGIDISRFNTMIISSMPRNIAEYIQASSRVARDKEGLVLTVHHPFRSRDISHYQKFKEFHEKFYSFVEPISVTPFATKALDRYFPLLLATIIRHNTELGLTNNEDAIKITESNIPIIKNLIENIFKKIENNANILNNYLNSDRDYGLIENIIGIINENTIEEILDKTELLLNNWKSLAEENRINNNPLKYRNEQNNNNGLFIMNSSLNNSNKQWVVGQSLREIDPTTVIKTVQEQRN